MNNITDVYNQIAAADAEILEKQAAHIKVAEEEDAAGRIMARGFADELTKIAEGIKEMPKGKTIPVAPPKLKYPTGASGKGGMPGRTSGAPAVPAPTPVKAPKPVQSKPGVASPFNPPQ